MIINKFFVLLFFLHSVITPLLAQDTIYVTDFGAKPNSYLSTENAVNRALDECSKFEKSVLVFPKGRYDFWPDFNSEERSIGIKLNNLSNITVDGDSSQFIFHGKMQVAKLFNCSNVLLKNFSIDWDKPLIIQAQYVNTTDSFIDMAINKNDYLIENEKIFLIGEGWKERPVGFFTMFNPQKEIYYKTHDDQNKQLFLGKAEELQPGLVRFYGKPTIKPEIGSYHLLFAGAYIADGIEIRECKDVYLKDITMYHALSHGFLGLRSENITMDNANARVNEAKGRVFSLVADASHFKNCKGEIKIINCSHTGQGDDFINIHGFNILIDSIVDKTTLITAEPKQETLLAAGDEVWFVSKKSYQRTSTNTIKSIEWIPIGFNRTVFKISFTDPMPTDLATGDFIENKTWNPDVEIRNCRILKRNRARGILVTSPQKVLIEDNYFNTAGTAILIEGDIDHWYESGGVKDITIRNNTFDNCLTSGSINGTKWQWGEAIITITPSHHPQENTSIPYHKNINITNNTFKTFDVPLIHARSVDKLVFSGNNIIKTNAYKPYAWQKSSFYLIGCRNVEILGNHFQKEYNTRIIAIDKMKKSDLKYDVSDGFSLEKIDQFKDESF